MGRDKVFAVTLPPGSSSHTGKSEAQRKLGPQAREAGVA